MKKTKRIISALLVLIISLSAVPFSGMNITAHAYVVDSGLCGDNVIYKLSSDGVLTISGTGAIKDFPNSRDYLFTTRPFPWKKDEVRRVVIEDGVTRIGEYAFSEHYYMTDIQIPDSVTSIGEGAFQWCSSLSSLVLPEKLTTIPKNMCVIANLRYVSIPAAVKEIGNGAFNHNYTLIEVEYGGTQAQWNKVSVGTGNEYLSEAFTVYNGGSKLSSTQKGKCGDNVTWSLSTNGTLKISGKGDMDSYAKASVGGFVGNYSKGTDHPWYKYRSKIKKIIITSGVTSVGKYAFFDCFNCTSLEIQNGVQTIKEGAFAYMPVSSLSLPKSVSDVGEYAFYSCSALKKVTLSESITVLDKGLFEYCRNLESLVLPKKLTKIDFSALHGCDFDGLTIPATVTYIGANFPHITTVKFLGALPEFDDSDGFISADYFYCQPEYYKSYRDAFEKSRSEGVLSDGPVCAKLDKTTLTLTAEEPAYQLTVTDESGTAKSVTKKWWVEKPETASVNKQGVVTASGHGKTKLYVEISSGGYHSIASCNVSTKRNDLMVELLPKELEADFPVTLGAKIGGLETVGYQPGKLAETDTDNKYYKELLSLTKKLTSGCSSDKQRASAIFGWVSENVTYGGAIGIGNQADQAYAVYLNRKAHCEGFAKLTGFMLYLAGIPSCLVASYAHMWNIALLDGEWTMIDSTNGEFGNDYNDCSAIEWIGFGVDELCFVIDSTEGIKLAGVGNHALTEERNVYTHIDVPDFVDIIFGYAFDGCTNLKSVTLPDSVKKITKRAFYGCNNLTDVYYSGSKAQWQKVSVDSTNTAVKRATIHYNRCQNHSYKTTTVKATPSKNGKVVKTCSLCGDVKSVTTIYYPKTSILSKTSYTYNGKEQKPTVTVKDSKGNVLKNGTDYTVKYENGRIATGRYNVKITFKGKYSGTKTLTYTIAPKATSKVTTVQSAKAIKLTWSKVTGADGYRVYQYNAKTKTWDKIKTTTATSYKVEKLKAGTAYKFRIKAYRNDAGTIWGKATSTITVATKPATPKITAVASTAKGRAAVAWANVSGETGYELYASTKKDSGYKKVVTTTADVTNGVRTGLVSGRTYYFRVRAYKLYGNTVVYSALSAPQALKVR